MRFKILHYLALKTLRLSSYLSVLARAESCSRAVSYHEMSLARDRAKKLGKMIRTTTETRTGDSVTVKSGQVVYNNKNTPLTVYRPSGSEIVIEPGSSFKTGDNPNQR